MTTDEMVQKLERAKELLQIGPSGIVHEPITIIDDILFEFLSYKHKVVKWEGDSPNETMELKN